MYFYLPPESVAIGRSIKSTNDRSPDAEQISRWPLLNSHNTRVGFESIFNFVSMDTKSFGISFNYTRPRAGENCRIVL